MKKHGGARIGAGRPATPVDVRRAIVLRKQGFSYRQIAERFGVTTGIVRRAITNQTKKESI
jgi:DNA-directed RNA polymerase specialized sigma24 family protein